MKFKNFDVLTSLNNLIEGSEEEFDILHERDCTEGQRIALDEAIDLFDKAFGTLVDAGWMYGLENRSQ